MNRGADTVRTLHIGPYERLIETYAALQSYAATHGLRLDQQVMWEEYRSHPEVEPALTATVVHWPCTRVPTPDRRLIATPPRCAAGL